MNSGKTVATRPAQVFAPTHRKSRKWAPNVQQDEFVGFASGADLAGVTQADHVLGEVAPVGPAHAGLTHHEGLESFAAQLLQHGRGREVVPPLERVQPHPAKPHSWRSGRARGNSGRRQRIRPGAGHRPGPAFEPRTVAAGRWPAQLQA
jgi:hypothetical protein